MRPIKPPFTPVPAGGAVCALQLARGCGGAGRPPIPRTLWVSPWHKAGMAWGAGGRRVRQTGFGTSRWLSLLQNAPTAYVVGRDCHNAAQQSSSKQPCCVTLCHLWHRAPTSHLLYPLFHLCCSEMLYFFRVGLFFYPILHQPLSKPCNRKTVVLRGLTSG